MAGGGDLLNVVSKLQESLTAWEELGSEVSAEAITEDGDIIGEGDQSQLLNLLWEKELGLVDEDAVNLIEREVEEVGVIMK